MKLTYLVGLISMCVMANSAFAASNDQVFNPKPLKDDVILSMPCDGQMVFRKVYTGDDEKLKDRGFSAGSNDSGQPIAQSLNRRYIQGPFHDKNGYYYLMAKYELTQGQAKLLKAYHEAQEKHTDLKCDGLKMNVKDRLPMTNISWYDAIDLSRYYSEYLQKAKDDIKGNDGALAFARLPTDSEWEFAVRGGLEVSSSEFNADVFPMAEGKSIADYAWYKGADSANNGRVQVVGYKEPNPLGLFDMLGNVGEMMMDPFYATRTGRLHGQSGGYIVRGGSVSSSKDDMYSSQRSERAFYTRGKETKEATTGVRFVLSLPFTSTIQEVRSLNDELSKLGDDDASDVKSGGNLKTIAALDKIIAQQKEAQKKSDNDNKSLQDSVNSLTASLANLRAQMVEANAKKDEMRDKAIVSALRLGGYLCSSIASQRAVQQTNELREKAILGLSLPSCREDANSEKCKADTKMRDAKLKANRENAQILLDYYVRYYADHINDTLDTFDLKFIDAQVKNAQKALGENKGSLPEYIAQFSKDIDDYNKGGRNLQKNEQKWIEQCRALKK